MDDGTDKTIAVDLPHNGYKHSLEIIISDTQSCCELLLHIITDSV